MCWGGGVGLGAHTIVRADLKISIFSGRKELKKKLERETQYERQNWDSFLKKKTSVKKKRPANANFKPLDALVHFAELENVS